ncbi:MAG: hypothetical protein F6K09_21070 [Merismopedia sp. SIO2A8]|nr:hypothetical protein [Symploca sp. SIO2B6]NET51122.1 hypothetical protein [Merismopedia sp. SIO2A8]
MSKSLPPERLQELAAGYVLGNLAPEEAEQFQQLLTNNPELAVEVDSLQEVLGLMPYALPEVAPPQSLRSVILETALASAKPATSKRQRSPSPWLWSGIAASAAALLATTIGLDNYRLRQELYLVKAELVQKQEMIAKLEQPNNLLVSLEDSQLSADAPIVISSEVLLEKNWDGIDKILQDHLRSLLSKRPKVDLPSSEPTKIIEHFQGQLSFSSDVPSLSQTGSKLLGGSFCKFGKTKGIRFTYQLQGEQTVSFYQLKRSQQPSFPQLGKERLYVAQQGSPTMLIWSDGQLLYALVAQLSPQELELLATHIKYV